MGQIPDLFLMANRELMEDVGLATGVILVLKTGITRTTARGRASTCGPTFRAR